MNKVILVGNLVRDPEFQTTPSGVSLARFSLAVQRRYSNSEGNREADFLNCVAWRNNAEFINKYFKKGSRIGIVGSLQTRTYETTEGAKRTATDVVVEEAEFVGPRQDDGRESEPSDNVSKPEAKPNLTPIEDDDLPF